MKLFKIFEDNLQTSKNNEVNGLDGFTIFGKRLTSKSRYILYINFSQYN